MKRPAVPLLLLGLVALAIYTALGLGYHRLIAACYESRHSQDRVAGALTGTPAAVVDVTLWPVFLVFTPSDLSCRPLPVGG